MENTPQIILQGITLPDFLYQVRAIINPPSGPAAASAAPISDVIDSKEVRQLLNVSHATLIRYRQEGRIPFTKVGNKIFHSRAAVLKAFGGAA